MATTSMETDWESKADRRAISADGNNDYLGPGNCLLKLREWNDHFPGKADNVNDRLTMEMALEELGRVDLAKYVERNQRVIKFLASLTDYGLNDHSRELSYEDPERNWNLRNDRSTAKADGKKKKRTGPRKRKFNQMNSTDNIMNAQKVVAAAQVKSKSKIVRKKASSESSITQPHPSNNKAILAVLLGLSTVLICILVLLFIQKYRRRRSLIQFSDNWGNRKVNNDICCDCCGCKRQLSQKICGYSYHTDNENEGKWSRCTSGCTCYQKCCCQMFQTFSDMYCDEQLSTTSLPRYKESNLKKDKKRSMKRRKRRRLGSFEVEKKSRSNKRDKDQINYKRKCFKKQRIVRRKIEEGENVNSMSDVSDVSILAQTAKGYDRQESKKNEKRANIFGTSYPQCGCCKCAFISEGTMTK